MHSIPFAAFIRIKLQVFPTLRDRDKPKCEHQGSWGTIMDLFVMVITYYDYIFAIITIFIVGVIASSSVELAVSQALFSVTCLY